VFGGSCGGSTCQPKCTGDASCPSTPAGLLTCGPGGKCQPKTCTPTSCPTNFTCPSDGSGCVRTTCTTDSQCAGACVNGTCWSGPGTCRPIPA
jgi:hypothetical protein